MPAYCGSERTEMTRWDDVKKLKDVAKQKIDETDLTRLAGDALLGAQSAAEGADAIAQRSGLTKKNGEISKLKVARAAARPRKTAKIIASAAADEVRSRREDAATTPAEPTTP